MRIKVGLSDIIYGVRGSGYRCMVARAIRRQRPQLGPVQVTPAYVRLDYNGQLHVLPAPVRKKILAFDDHRWVLPFSFELLV